MVTGPRGPQGKIVRTLAAGWIAQDVALRSALSWRVTFHRWGTATLTGKRCHLYPHGKLALWLQLNRLSASLGGRSPHCWCRACGWDSFRLCELSCSAPTRRDRRIAWSMNRGRETGSRTRSILGTRLRSSPSSTVSSATTPTCGSCGCAPDCSQGASGDRDPPPVRGAVPAGGAIASRADPARPRRSAASFASGSLTRCRCMPAGASIRRARRVQSRRGSSDRSRRARADSQGATGETAAESGPGSRRGHVRAPATTERAGMARHGASGPTAREHPRPHRTGMGTTPHRDRQPGRAAAVDAAWH